MFRDHIWLRLLVIQHLISQTVAKVDLGGLLVRNVVVMGRPMTREVIRDWDGTSRGSIVVVLNIGQL